jgi:hypothetical protein
MGSVYKDREYLLVIGFLFSLHQTHIHTNTYLEHNHITNTTQSSIRFLTHKQPNLPTTNMHFLDIHLNRTSPKGKQTNEQPRSSVSSEQQAQASKKKMSAAEDYWTNPALGYGFMYSPAPKRS